MAEKFRRAVVGIVRRSPEPDPKDPTTTSLMNAGSLGNLTSADLIPKPESASKGNPVPADFRNAAKPEPDSVKEPSKQHGGLMPKLPLLPGSFHDAVPVPEKKDEPPCSSKLFYPALHIHIPDNQEP